MTFHIEFSAHPCKNFRVGAHQCKKILHRCAPVQKPCAHRCKKICTGAHQGEYFCIGAHRCTFPSLWHGIMHIFTFMAFHIEFSAHQCKKKLPWCAPVQKNFAPMRTSAKTMCAPMQNFLQRCALMRKVLHWCAHVRKVDSVRTGANLFASVRTSAESFAPVRTKANIFA